MTEPPPAGLSGREAEELAGDLAQAHRERAVATAVARAGIARAEALAGGRAPVGPARVRWGWRAAVRFAVERRMYTPAYLHLYARFLAHRLRRPQVEHLGMTFLGRGADLYARPGHGRLQVGPWCWFGDRTSVRCHEGDVRIGAKVVMGTANTVNAYLDIEIGRDSLLADRIYVCDFDHRHDRVDVPIRKQGIRKSPTRIGEDVWVGEKASILRGADIGSGSVVASQSVVRGVIPPFSIVVGMPARVVRSRLPEGMTAEEALDLQRRGQAIPGDPLD
jgi:acetyltransferase-like isoleucine patch superfamily enzyme